MKTAYDQQMCDSRELVKLTTAEMDLKYEGSVGKIIGFIFNV